MSVTACVTLFQAGRAVFSGVSASRPRLREVASDLDRDVRPAERIRMNSMVPRTWLLSGVPRSGTSLCCRLAGDLPDTVALSEPIRRKAFGGMDTPHGACARIGDFAEQARGRILAERRGSAVPPAGPHLRAACGTDEPQPQRSVRHSHDRCSSGGVAGQRRATDPVLLPRGLRRRTSPSAGSTTG